MEVTEIINLISNMPTWGWVVLFFIFIIIAADAVLWEYEVKFPMQAGIGRGEVELKCNKKKGTRIEIKLDLTPAYHNQEIEVFRNGRSIYKAEAKLNTGKRVFIQQRTVLKEPSEGDEIVVKIDGKKAFTGLLVLD